MDNLGLRQQLDANDRTLHHPTIRDKANTNFTHIVTKPQVLPLDDNELSRLFGWKSILNKQASTIFRVISAAKKLVLLVPLTLASMQIINWRTVVVPQISLNKRYHVTTTLKEKQTKTSWNTSATHPLNPLGCYINCTVHKQIFFSRDLLTIPEALLQRTVQPQTFLAGFVNGIHFHGLTRLWPIFALFCL